MTVGNDLQKAYLACSGIQVLHARKTAHRQLMRKALRAHAWPRLVLLAFYTHAKKLVETQSICHLGAILPCMYTYCDKKTAFQGRLSYAGKVPLAWEQAIATMKKGEVAIIVNQETTAKSTQCNTGSHSPSTLPFFVLELIDWTSKCQTICSGVSKTVVKSGTGEQRPGPQDICQGSARSVHDHRAFLKVKRCWAAQYHIDIDQSFPS